MHSFAHCINYRIVLRPKSSVLSFSAFSIPTPDLTARGHSTKLARLRPEAQYENMLSKPKPPLAVAGVRNVLANLRCIGYSAAMCKQFNRPEGTLAAVSEEKLSKARPYHAIRYAGGSYSIVEYVAGDSLKGVEWLVAGIPVLWDCDEGELLERIVTEAADHSHVWYIPRGEHPSATEITHAQWTAIHDIFLATIDSNRSTAAKAILEKAQELSLIRERKYLHSVWGVAKDGSIVVVIGHGTLEDLGRDAAKMGATRALCVENGGSCAFYLVPDSPAQSWKLQICGPNFRPRGTAFVYFELYDRDYSVLEGDSSV